MNYKKIIASLAILSFCFLSFSFANIAKAAPVPTTITVTQAPANTDGTVDDALQTQPIVNVKDETSANMPGVTVTAVLVDGTGSLVAGNTAVTDVNGDATFSGLKYNKSGETFTIKFTAGAIETAKSANITALTNGEATNFLIAGIDDPVVAGTTIASFTVTARDQYNNIAEDYTGTIEFSSSDTTATLPSDYTFNPVTDSGVAPFSNEVVLTKAGDQTVIATDTSDATITGAQTGITVTNDVATKYVIINPTDGTVDNPITVTVQLHDQYDNIVTTGADKDKGVTLVTDGSATGAGLVTISNGVGTLNISNTLPETVSLSLTDSGITGFDVSSTQDVVFAHGAATKVVFSQEPSTPTVAGVSFTNQPIVNILDQYNNLVSSDSTSSVVIKAFTTADCLTAASPDLTGTLNVTASAGVSTFSGISYTKTSPGNLYVQASLGALTPACSGALTITPATATSLLVDSISNPLTAGVASDVKVTAIDAFGNVDTNYAGTVGFFSPDSKPTTVLPADYTFVAGDNGVKTFTSGVVLTTAGTQEVKAYDKNDISITGTQTGIVVNNTSGSKYVIINPTDGTVDNPITVTVQLHDQYDNIVTTGADKDKGVTLVTDGSATGAGLVTISNGVGTLNISNTVSETVNLSLTDSGLTGFDVSSTQDVVFAHGAATKVVFSQEPSTPTVAGVSFTNQPIVNILDQYNNLVSSDSTSSVVIKAFTTADCLTAASPDLTGTLNVTASAGVSTFSGISYTKTSPGNLYVQASLGALTPACSGALTITPATATSLLVDSISNPLTAGVASDVKVTAIDAFGNVDTNYAGTVGFASTDTKITTILPSPYTFVAGDNGVKTFVGGVKLTTSGNQTVSASDGLISGAQTGIVVNNAGGSKYVIIDPADGTVDNPITVTVQLYDQYDNIVTTGADKDKGVTLVTDSSAGTGMFLVTISNGIGTKNITNQKAETVGLSLFDGGATGFDVSSTQDVVFAHGVATKIVFSQEPSATTVAGIPFANQPIIAIQDQYDNVITSDSASSIAIKAYNNPGCSIAASPDLTGALSVQAINGVSTFSGVSYTKTSLGNLYVKASVGGFSVCAGPLTITPASATSLLVDSISNPLTAGVASDVKVTAIDEFGNVDTNYAGTVGFFVSTDTKPTTILPANYTFVAGDNGVKTFTSGVVLTTAGTHNVVASDTVLTSIKGMQTGIVVNNTSGSKYVIIDPTDGTVDNPITVTVQLQDQYDNIVTTGADKDKGVTLVTDGSATGAGLVTISNGVGTLDISNTLPETVNLSLTDTQGTTFNVSSTQDVVFVPGVATELYFSVQPSDKAYTYVNFGIQPTVVLRDQFGNVRSDVNPVTLLVDTVDSTCANAAANADFIGTKTQPAGTSFAGLKYNKIDTDGIWLCATSGALTGVSNKISVYTSSAPSSSGGSTSFSTTPTTTIPQGEVKGISDEKEESFSSMPQPAKPIAQMTQTEKNSYVMELQTFLIQLLTQLLNMMKK